jgi:hypothetical protein
MEIGSFIELDIENIGEYFPDDENVARLNSARAGIYHSLQLLGSNEVYMPYYQCPTVNDFLLKKGVTIFKYQLSNEFEPQLQSVIKDSTVLLVNYFGIFSNDFLKKLTKKYKKVIIDNGPAFYNPPIEGCMNVYSARKFFGVPDGCYVIGKQANMLTERYPQDYSSETSLFLLERHEVGCSASYEERMKNEERIDNADILSMSRLTKSLLSGINYQRIRDIRRRNFEYAHNQYKELNLLDVTRHYDDSCVPMFYPLVIEEASMVEELTRRQIFTGRRWNAVLKEVDLDSFEGWLSRYMIPLPIDQRYGKEVLDYVFQNVQQILKIKK